MALIILGVLLVLGVVFIALINKNIRGARSSEQRSLAFDLAEAGVRYVHTQMLNSGQGADWRPTPMPLPIATTDVDYKYIRPANPADPADHGGPDKQGSYTRLIMDKGRVLVRARYGPSDPTVLSTTAIGNLFQPGAARNYTIIDSIGMAKTIVPNDPTSSSLQSGETREITESKRVIAFVSLGLIENARFVHNKFNVSTPAEYGWPDNIGVQYAEGGGANVNVPVLLGTAATLPNPYDGRSGGNSAGNTADIPYGGSMRVNGDLLIYGQVISNLNRLLGDKFFVSGSIHGAEGTSQLSVNVGAPNAATPTVWQTPAQSFNLVNNGTPVALNSESPNFNTLGDLYKDGFTNGDSQGFPRGVSRQDPPSILRADPDTGVNRFVQITQLSGKTYNFGNSGRFGQGQGVFVNNAADIQMATDEQGREDVGSAQSLTYDWLNPDNGQANTGWKGPFYIPRGAYMRLYSDGFAIVRDGRAPQNQRAWRMADGSPSKRPGASMTSTNAADIIDSPFIRYKLVPDPATGQTYIFNSYSVTPAGVVVDLNQINSTTLNTWRSAGYPFNGVVYFQGNVRIRGQIPTDMQLTVVSNATIYVEGSITKGVVNNGTRPSIPVGRRIDTPSKSMIALLAKDYVCLNTTQFFGTNVQQTLDEVKDNAGPVEWNPVRVKTGGSINFVTEFLLDPNTSPAAGGNPNNPSSLRPYVNQYLPAGATTGFQETQLLLAHAMDDGPAPATFINMNVNFPLAVGTQNWQYMFDLSTYNAASSSYPVGYTAPGYSVADKAPLYGLGGQSWQRYAKFEAAAYPLVSNDFTWNTNQMVLSGSSTSRMGLYHLLAEESNDFSIGLRDTVGGTPTNDYVIARAAIVPHDIRIEATMFAEEGSFFVIPGPWFNPNPNDRRDTYMTLGATTADRDLARLESFGSMPHMPFYGEPLDVKIQIIGSVSENMPPPISQQAEWLKKWGWIPRYHGASGELIPQQHVPNGYDVTPSGANDLYVPNITITYDPSLATGRNFGFVGAAGPAVDLNTFIRFGGVDVNGDGTKDVFYALPPLPRLPVSPTLAYFGEVNP